MAFLTWYRRYRETGVPRQEYKGAQTQLFHASCSQDFTTVCRSLDVFPSCSQIYSLRNQEDDPFLPACRSAIPSEAHRDVDSKPHISEFRHRLSKRSFASAMQTGDTVTSRSLQSASGIGSLTDAVLLKFKLPKDICSGLRIMASTLPPSKWQPTLQGRGYCLKKNESLALAVALSADLGIDLVVEKPRVSYS
jgi:hypothetical protein